MSKLYINIEEKSKNEISGTIYNRVRNNVDERVYLRFKAVRTGESLFKLEVYGCPCREVYTVALDETFDCCMTAKDILFYVEQRIEYLRRL